MGAALSWLLLAAGLALGGSGPRPARAAHRAPAARDRDARLSPGALAALAAGAVAVGAVLLAGPVSGPITATVLAPPAAVLARHAARRPTRSGPDPGLPLALDLAAAALRSGRTVADALRLGAPVLPAATARRWQRAAGLLALGADPELAWAALADDTALATVAAAARRSADSGARLARSLTQLAERTRAELRADALARANRAGVLAMAPLGLCFLPAFVCLGIVPTVVGIAHGVLPGLS